MRTTGSVIFHHFAAHRAAYASLASPCITGKHDNYQSGRVELSNICG